MTDWYIFIIPRQIFISRRHNYLARNQNCIGRSKFFSEKGLPCNNIGHTFREKGLPGGKGRLIELCKILRWGEGVSIWVSLDRKVLQFTFFFQLLWLWSIISLTSVHNCIHGKYNSICHLWNYLSSSLNFDVNLKLYICLFEKSLRLPPNRKLIHFLGLLQYIIVIKFSSNFWEFYYYNELSTDH